jgi:hypothetical protein
MYGGVLESFGRPGSRIIDGTEMLEILLSVYCVILHARRMTLRLGLGVLLRKALRAQLRDVRPKIRELSLGDVAWTNLWIFGNVLARMRPFSSIGRKLMRYLRLAGMRAVGSYEFHLLDHVKRPIVTFDQTLFAKIDEEIFGHPELRRAG